MIQAADGQQTDGPDDQLFIVSPCPADGCSPVNEADSAFRLTAVEHRSCSSSSFYNCFSSCTYSSYNSSSFSVFISFSCCSSNCYFKRTETTAPPAFFVVALPVRFFSSFFYTALSLLVFCSCTLWNYWKKFSSHTSTKKHKNTNKQLCNLPAIYFCFCFDVTLNN